MDRLGLAVELKQSDVSAFEREPDDKWSREPALPHLLRYARVAGVNVENAASMMSWNCRTS